MTTVESEIQGAALTPLGCAAANGWLTWLTGEGSAPTDDYGVRFALAHCDSGVTWGYRHGAGVWKLGSTVDDTLCPIPTAGSLHELRLFGAAAEILIWRADGSELRGRILADVAAEANTDGPLRPYCEPRWLRGSPVETRDGFTLYTDAGGARHLAPSSLGPSFSVRHYLAQDCVTGAVRIVATRLLDAHLTKGEKS